MADDVAALEAVLQCLEAFWIAKKMNVTAPTHGREESMRGIKC